MSPVWYLTLNLKQYLSDEDPTEPQQVIDIAKKVRQQLVKFRESRLTQLKAERENVDLEELRSIEDELELMDPEVEPSVAHATAEELTYEFNRILEWIYDWADLNRVWIGGEKVVRS